MRARQAPHRRRTHPPEGRRTAEGVDPCPSSCGRVSRSADAAKGCELDDALPARAPACEQARGFRLSPMGRDARKLCTGCSRDARGRILRHAEADLGSRAWEGMSHSSSASIASSAPHQELRGTSRSASGFRSLVLPQLPGPRVPAHKILAGVGGPLPRPAKRWHTHHTWCHHPRRCPIVHTLPPAVELPARGTAAAERGAVPGSFNMALAGMPAEATSRSGRRSASVPSVLRRMVSNRTVVVAATAVLLLSWLWWLFLATASKPPVAKTIPHSLSSSELRPWEATRRVAWSPQPRASGRGGVRLSLTDHDAARSRPSPGNPQESAPSWRHGSDAMPRKCTRRSCRSAWTPRNARAM